MNSLWVLMISLLLTSSFGQEVDEQPRKHNIVSRFLNSQLEKLVGKTLNIPEIGLGEAGKFSNVEAGIFGGLTKQIDGVRYWGFDLNMSVASLAVKGQYDLLHLDVPGLFPVFGKGDFMIVLDLVLNTTVSANLIDDSFEVDMSRFVISANNTTVKFENLMNDPHLADFLNELLSNLLPKVVAMVNEPLFGILKNLTPYYGNGILKCIKDEFSNVVQCITHLFFPDDHFNFDIGIRSR